VGASGNRLAEIEPDLLYYWYGHWGEFVKLYRFDLKDSRGGKWVAPKDKDGFVIRDIYTRLQITESKNPAEPVRTTIRHYVEYWYNPRGSDSLRPGFTMQSEQDWIDSIRGAIALFGALDPPPKPDLIQKTRDMYVGRGHFCTSGTYYIKGRLYYYQNDSPTETTLPGFEANNPLVPEAGILPSMELQAHDWTDPMAGWPGLAVPEIVPELCGIDNKLVFGPFQHDAGVMWEIDQPTKDPGRTVFA
jgi:hypothetical protein